MRIAHVRERNAPAGAPWRLAAALGPGAAGQSEPRRWLDVEVARRRLAARDPERAHNSDLFRQPLTTLDALLERGLRVAALGEIVELEGGHDAVDPDDDAILDAADLRFGPPILRPPAFRDFYAFEQHVRTMWERRGGEIPENWYRLPVFYFSNTSEIRGPGDPVWAPRGSAELDFELEVGALVDTPAFDLSPERAEEAIGGYFVLNDWSARDLQRDEMPVRMGPAKGKDFATSIGPWLVTPDELADARVDGATGPDLAMTRHGHRRVRDDDAGVERAVVRRAILVRGDARPGVCRRARPARARSWDRGRPGPAASSRSGTRRSVAGSSRGTR